MDTFLPGKHRKADFPETGKHVTAFDLAAETHPQSLA